MIIAAVWLSKMYLFHQLLHKATRQVTCAVQGPPLSHYLAPKMHNSSELLMPTRPSLYWFLDWSRSSGPFCPRASGKYPIMSVCTLLYHSHSIWAASSFVSAWWVVTALRVMSFVVCAGILCVVVFTRVSRELFVGPRQCCAGGLGRGFRVDHELRFNTTWQCIILQWMDDPDIYCPCND